MSEHTVRESHAADLAYAHDLSLPQGRQLSDLAIHNLDPSFRPESLAHLADPAVAAAFVDAPLGVHASDDSVEQAEVVACRAIGRGFETAGAWFVLACVAEHRGALDLQRSQLERALELDRSFGPALAALGIRSFIEGDARRAERLLAACGDRRLEPYHHTLSHYPTPSPAAGRNEPCPCGSERKYKHCCIDRVGWPLAERAGWLWDKAEAWLTCLPQHGPLMALIEELVGADEEMCLSEPSDELLEAVEAVPVRALALLEGGLLGRFLHRYGRLLPDDERELAETWMQARHSVWRVEDTTPGRTLVLTDLAGGRTVEASNGAVSRCTRPGEIVYGAVVPTSDGWLLPCHPTCLDPDDGRALAELLVGGIDPMSVASTLVRGIESGTM
jgi:hypothetical protein